MTRIVQVTREQELVAQQEHRLREYWGGSFKETISFYAPFLAFVVILAVSRWLS